MEAHEIARRVQAARGYAGMISQHQLANRVGVSRSTVARWENPADDYIPDPGRQVAIARKCGLPDNWFTLDLAVAGTESPSPDPADFARAIAVELAGLLSPAFAEAVEDQLTRDAAARAATGDTRDQHPGQGRRTA